MRKFELYRQLINPDIEKWYSPKGAETHFISVEMKTGKDVFSTDVMSIHIHQLRDAFDKAKEILLCMEKTNTCPSHNYKYLGKRRILW